METPDAGVGLSVTLVQIHHRHFNRLARMYFPTSFAPYQPPCRFCNYRRASYN